MKKTKPKYIGTIAFLIAVVVCIFFTAHAGALVTEYARTINEHAAKRAMFYADEVALGVRETCDDFRREADFVAEKLSECVSERETAEELKKLYLSGIASDTFLTVFYLKDGEFINPEGQIVSGYSELNEIKKSETDKLTHVFQYDNKIMTIAAFTRTSGGYADGAVVLFDRAYLSLNIFREDGKRADDDGAKLAEFVALIRHDGKPLDKLENSDVFTLDNDTLQNGVLKEYLSGKDTDEFVRAIANGNEYSFVFRKGTDDYALALVSLGEENGFIAVASAYKISVIYGEGYGVAQSIWAAGLGLAFVMAILTVSMIVGYINSKSRIYRLEMIDSTLNCATPKKFEKDAESILARHKNINFALISLKISNFNYVNENFGDTASDNLAAFAVGIVKHALLIDETFAYAGDGELLLLLYYKDRKSFTDRLNGLYLRLARYEGLKDRDYTVSASFAVYEIEKDIKQTIKDCMNKLKTVKDASGVTVGSFSVNFYEDMLREKSVRKAEIEGKMESALENNEFHLFYQPKYNLRTKKADGCEILIRWYDPKLESYRSPGVFLPVFEEDGFICKIDRFVFYKACENIAARVAATKIVYPVSVNVSRVTAIQPDFVDYYVRIKNKFNIKDGFITLEFTESFAFENYGFLSEIIEKLHKNGFLCSIDDFGTGYSSYNILKTVPVDEIKLDKFFLEKGVSEDRDQTLLKSVIEMIKKLGIKATQEGVETREDFDRLQSLGCDVIQGYFFAKPMKYTDYCEFIEKNFG